MSIEMTLCIFAVCITLLAVGGIILSNKISKLLNMIVVLDRKVTNNDIRTSEDLLDIHGWIKAANRTTKSTLNMFDALIAKCASLDARIKDKEKDDE